MKNRSIKTIVEPFLFLCHYIINVNHLARLQANEHTQDDRKQSKLAEKEIEKAISSGEKLMIQPIVLCELVWVLESAYDYRKSEILTVLDQIMRTAQFEIIDKDTVWRALNDFYESKGDFADYYNGRANKRSGAIITLTFDKLLKDSEIFSVL